MRVLFVVPPLAGHVNPTVSVAAALCSLGHEVAWVAHPGAVAPLLPPNARLFALDDGVSPSKVEDVRAKAQARGLLAFKYLWEDFFLPLARAMAPAVEEVARAYRPDVMVVDQQALGGLIAARRVGVPHVSFVTTSASVVDPLAGLPHVRAWLMCLLRALEDDAGLPPAAAPDLSDACVVVFSTRALVGEAHVFPPHHHFVGPAFTGRAQGSLAELPPLPRRPRVLVSLGTVNRERGDRFFCVAARAALAAEVSAIVVAEPAQLAGAGVAQHSARILVKPHVPQLALLPEVDAVVCHAGHNTVCEALSYALPLVVAPIRDDQPVIAQQVVDAGAGVRVRYGRVGEAELAAAITRAVHAPELARGAARIRDSFVAAGGPQAAAQHVMAVAS